MTFSVRARLTNDAAEASQGAGARWLDNPDLKALATLYNRDPLVTADHESYILSASELDVLEHAPPAGGLTAAAATLLGRLNGAARLVLNHYMTPARLTGQIETNMSQSATASAPVWAYAPRDFTALDPASCAIVLAAASNDLMLNSLILLLGNQQRGFEWFDLWRIREALRRRAEDNGLDFHLWVGDDQTRLNFERSANDPGVSGPYARQGIWVPNRKAKDPTTGLPLGQPMTLRDATAFIPGFVRRWIEEDAGQQLVIEPSLTP